ncbi:2555_t:CDS:2 [Acaulospora morrowiae]|uniref:2555_t:CDS:1 n=1 Tax=Acaulospora morrowiae TaxID=94023 RepID=A0A9N9HVW9_9GLOM|nr:2555_t:CDS:2 [Acaulospora morrowiae]
MSGNNKVANPVLDSINFFKDIIVGALVILKPIFSTALALWIGYFALKFVSNSYYDEVSLILCSMPLSGMLPLCQTPIPDFTKLVNRQVDTYEQIMDQQLTYDGPSSSLALDIKKAELATADLRTLIKYSSLVSGPEIVNRLTEFVEKARNVGMNLQVLQSRTKSSLDNLITYNLFALKALENVRDKKVNARELRTAYSQMMTLIEGDLKRMILVGQAALGSLTDLDGILLSIHELTTQEASLQRAELGKLLAELWSIVGGNLEKKQIYRENLELLQDLERQRKIAVSQVQTTLYGLTSFQLDIEELREQVSRPSMIEMPIEVHIDNVGKGIERLRNSKVAIKSGGVIGDPKHKMMIDSGSDNKPIVDINLNSNVDTIDDINE